MPPPHPDTAAKPAPEDDPAVDIDLRISLVEQRLMAREQRLKQHTRQLAHRAQALAAPRNLVLKLGSLALAGGGLAWLLRRGHGRGHVAAAQPPHQPSGMTPLLLSLLPIAWPALPLRWRDRVSPATAATVLGLALPMVQQLVQRLRRRRPA